VASGRVGIAMTAVRRGACAEPGEISDLMALKIKYWSHEVVVLHEREIRKNQG